jgi:23S rRNA pseudouridine1911/1915/1917 synthase
VQDLVAPARYQFVFASDERARLDQFLVDQLAASEPTLTRSQLKRLIEAGDVTVNGAPSKTGHKLKPGDVIDVTILPPTEISARPQPMDLTILYEDAHLIVVDKPAGLVVHPAPGHPDGTLVNGLLAHCTDLAGIGGELRPGIVHRLDKDTSGVLVVAKDDATHHALVDRFRAHDLVREYIAVVAPAPRWSRTTFDTLYNRHPVHRKKFSSRVRAGKRAVTHAEVTTRFGDHAAQILCRLETGRTHQIRVHCADHGTPVVGDPLYARPPRHPDLAALAAALGRQALHATGLGLDHPITGEPLRFVSEPPPDMAALIRGLRALVSQ